MDVVTLIDAFVRKVNREPRRRIREEDVPHPLRENGAAFGLYYDWTIQRFSRINWILPLEESLQRPLPSTYRSLVTRYIFPAFDVGTITLLANTGRTLYHEMFMTMLHDKVISDILLTNGYAQFARPSDGHSDPVCFDLNRMDATGESPIVRLNHHALVATAQINVMDEISMSFAQYVDRYLEQDPVPVTI